MVSNVQVPSPDRTQAHDRESCAPAWGLPAPIVVALLAVIGCTAILFFFNPSQYGFYPVCVFHKSTGLLCPGCGSLRALHQLLHGNLVGAIHFNALLVAAIPLAAWFCIRAGLRKLTGQPAGILIRPAWLWCGLAVMVVFGIVRNLPLGRVAGLAP